MSNYSNNSLYNKAVKKEAIKKRWHQQNTNNR